MKIIVAPDKFKGSLTSFEVCKAISSGIHKYDQAIQVLEFPMADGGDGFATVMKQYLDTNTVYCYTLDPLGRVINVSYEWNKKSGTAIIEMAVASGLVLLKESERNPLITSTTGTGLMIKDAIGRGATKIILGLGGSATSDAGTGILGALGFEFLGDGLERLKPSGENLIKIKKIVKPAFVPSINFEIASDVQNILYGPQGAAYVYASQKGADTTQLEILDKGLQNFAGVIEEQTGKVISAIAGTGAAGGIAAGLLPFFDVEMKKGIEMISEISRIREQLNGTGLLITGEGKIDAQTGEGKVISYIAALAKQYGIPAMALCGELELDDPGLTKLGLQKTIAISDGSVNRDQAMKNAAALLSEKAAALLRYL
jgi:glycerate kinase